MAAIVPNAQAAATPFLAPSPSVSQSCQSSQTVICASSQICRPGLSGSFFQGSHKITGRRGYLDSRKRLKVKWGLKAKASAEVNEEVLTAQEKYLQSIYGPSLQPKKEDIDMFGGLKDMFKGITKSVGTGDNSASDAVNSAAGNEAAGDAILSAKEQLLQTFGGGLDNQLGSETTNLDGLGGFKDAQNAATDSVNNLFKDSAEAVDSLKTNVVKSATENGSAVDASSGVKSVDNLFQGITDSVNSVSSSVSENVVKSATEDGSGAEPVTNAEDSVNKFMQSITDAVDSLDSSAQDSVVMSSATDGSAEEAVSKAKDSVTKFVEAAAGSVEGASSSVTNNSIIEDGSAGEIMQSAKNSMESIPNAPEAFEPASSFLSDSVVKSATEGGASGDTLSSLTESVNNAVQGISDTIDSAGTSASNSVVKSATENGSAGEAVLSAKERYLQAIGGGVQQSDNNDLFDGFKSADIDVLSGLRDAQDSVSSVVKSITGAVDTAGNAVKDTYENFNGSLVKLLRSVTGSVDKSVSGIPPSVDGVKPPKVSVDVDFSAPFRTGTPANDALKDVVFVVKDVTGKAFVTAGDLVSNFYSIAKDSLPEDAVTTLNGIEDKVSQVAQPVGEALNQAYAVVIETEKAVGINPENPVVPVILVVGSTLFISVSWFQRKYGGYAGDLQPSEALDLLKKEGNVVLVDIRPQELRETEGIPDLRGSTRYKFAAVEVLKADKAIRGQLKNASEIDSLLTAAVIRNLRNVYGGAKIILLDEDGSQSKQIARGLRKSGTKRAYRVEGGYKAWAKEGLRSKIDAPQTPLTVLKEEAEAIVEELKPTVGGVIGVSVGLVASTYALLEWEKALQLIGFIGLAASIYLRVESYQSVDDVKADIQILQKPLKSLIQGILLLTGQAEKGELQLATSPASSAVQGRMLQAAAKHGAASEKEQTEVTSNATEEEMASAVDDNELTQSHSANMSQQEPPQ